MNRKFLPAAIFVAWLSLIIAIFACTRVTTNSQLWRAPEKTAQGLNNEPVPLSTSIATGTRVPGAPIFTPTPDPVRVLPTLRVVTETYVVKRNDTLGQIARRFNVPLATLVEANGIANPDYLEPGQVLKIPPANPRQTGSSFKIIPDSELVYGPGSTNFDLASFIQQKNGYLANYQETVDGENYSGAAVVQRISQDYSVNPRLLLAVLEYQSGWVTRQQPPEDTRDYPIGVYDTNRKGLYRQLAWAANQLNRGYYLWRVNAISSWVLADSAVIPVSPTINAGTAGVQNFYSLLLDETRWNIAVSDQGVFATYNAFFGYPFDLAVEPVLPPGLAQPTMQLPFERGAIWSYTGGPHGGWADGSGWAAIDFAPPGEALGCVQSDAWVVAAADGLITRSANGAVVQDLDGDGFEQTGWSILYMHIETRDRVRPGTFLKAGDRVGHPSCEGGVSTGTHLHLARRYNGEWIPADGPLPFNLDGWISKGDGIEYDGYLVKNGVTVEALVGRKSENAISR